MAEMLVCVLDKINNADFYLNCQCPKAQDVIDIEPDGWPWGTEEIGRSMFQILKFPGLNVSDLTGLLAPEAATTNPPSKTLQYRGFLLSFTALQTAFPNPSLVSPNTSTGTNPMVTFSLPLATVLTCMVQKAPIADPHLVGPASSVIG